MNQVFYVSNTCWIRQFAWTHLLNKSMQLAVSKNFPQESHPKCYINWHLIWCVCENWKKKVNKNFVYHSYIITSWFEIRTSKIHSGHSSMFVILFRFSGWLQAKNRRSWKHTQTRPLKLWGKKKIPSTNCIHYLKSYFDKFL